MTRTRRRWRRRREPGLLLLQLSCYLLNFPPSLTPFWLPAGSDFLPNWPPAGVLSWPLPLFFPPSFTPAWLPSRSSSLRHVNPQQPLQSGSPSVCLLAGGVCHWVTASLSNWSDAAALMRRQASARTSPLAQHFFLSQHWSVTNRSIFLLLRQNKIISLVGALLGSKWPTFNRKQDNNSFKKCFCDQTIKEAHHFKYKKKVNLFFPHSLLCSARDVAAELLNQDEISLCAKCDKFHCEVRQKLRRLLGRIE